MRLAAAQADELSLQDAQKVVGEFLRPLAECPACEDSSEVIYRRGTELTGRGPHRDDEKVTLEPGESGPCPLCRGAGRGDPEWVEWHCASSQVYAECGPDKPGREGDDHTACGWRLVIPLREVTGG